MEWEDLERVHTERVAKDKAAAKRGKGKRGRKRKVSAQEADGNVGDEVERDANAQEAGSLVPTQKDKKKAKRGRVEQPDLEPCKAPGALMY
jgi:hypothetical protein